MVIHRTHSGFTLIELLVVVSVITILVIGAVAGYGSFSNRNLLKQTALSLKTNLRAAQGKVTSGNKPPVGSCTRLRSYQVTFTTDNYTIKPFCDPQGAFDGDTETFDFPDGISMTTLPTPNPVYFNILTNTTNILASTTIILTGSAGTYSVEIKNSGDIVDKGSTP